MKDLLSKIRTVEERDKLDGELDLLLTNLYEHQGSGLDSALRGQVRAWVSEAIRIGLPEDIGKAEDYLKSIKDKLAALKILKLKIAFEPTSSSIDKFFGFANKNISSGVILDFEIDPRIFGGAEITYRGEYRDFSLKRLFETEYKEKEAEMEKILFKRGTGETGNRQ